MQRRLVLEPTSRACKGNPLAVGRPGTVRIVARRVCKTFESGSVRPDCANFVIPIDVTGESDQVLGRRPCGEVIAGRAGVEFRCRSGLGIENDELARLATRRAVDETPTVRCPAREAVVSLAVCQHFEVTSVSPDDRDIGDRWAVKSLEESPETKCDLFPLWRPG